MTTYAIVGSREFTDRETLFAFMDNITRTLGIPDLVVSGGARGADALGIKWAEARGIATRIHYPQWHIHGRRAGAMRNQMIVNDADAVFAFCNNGILTPGTAITVNMAQQAGKPVYLITTALIHTRENGIKQRFYKDHPRPPR